MAKVIKDKYDLFTLAIKGSLIGTEIVFDDDTSSEIEDFFIDLTTMELHCDFVGGGGDNFNLRRKYTVKISDTYKSVSSKKKKKKAKRTKKSNS